MKKQLALLSFAILAMSCTPKSPALHIVTTGDIHGAYFPQSYVGSRLRPSLMSVKSWVDSLRTEVGPENVILLDAGDFLQGDNASYYFNYVATDKPHIYPRIAAEMGYDAIICGNHDIETGHAVYDRVARDLKACGIPFLAGNAVRPDGSLYFPEYTVVKKGGRKVLVMGYDNASIDAWLSEDLWSGMKFLPIAPMVQERVDALKAKVKPDAVVLVVHSGTGDGDGTQLENEGLDIFRNIKGVDLLVCGHDHRPMIDQREGCALVDGGSRAGTVTHTVISFGDKPEPGGNSVTASLVRLNKSIVDNALVQKFRPEFEEVKAFTLQPVGFLEKPIRTRDAYVGMSDYMNLLHSVQLAIPGVDVSFAAPLTFDGVIAGGRLVFNDMFSIYPYENQLFVVEMTGAEIKAYLEESYDRWVSHGPEHALRIYENPDPRTGMPRWSFVDRSYNFDSAAGIFYTVDITKPFGERIDIKSMADGSEFREEWTYRVAMTSYRASGGGELLKNARIVERHKEIRELVYDYIKSSGRVNPATLGDPSSVGGWKFVPESVAAPLLEKDMSLLFN